MVDMIPYLVSVCSNATVTCCFVFDMQVIDNQVVKVKRKETDGYTALQIGAINHPKIKRVIFFNR